MPKKKKPALRRRAHDFTSKDFKARGTCGGAAWDLLQQQELLGPAALSHPCLGGFELLQAPGLFLGVGHRVAMRVCPQRLYGNFCH